MARYMDGGLYCGIIRYRILTGHEVVVYLD